MNSENIITQGTQVTLPLVISASHSISIPDPVLAASLPNQLHMDGKAVEDGQNTWALSTHVGGQDRLTGFGLIRLWPLRHEPADRGSPSIEFF